MRECALGGCLPWPHDRLPQVPAERGLYTYGVGCTRIRCGECSERVSLVDDVWTCGCHSRKNTETIWLDRQPHDEWAPPELPWRCGGHPSATAEDFAELGFTEDVCHDVRTLLTTSDVPAHHPRGHPGYAVEVRLDLASAFSEVEVRRVLEEALSSDEDVAVLRAMAVLYHRNWLPLEGVDSRWAALRGRKVPGSEVLTLARLWAGNVARLAKREGPGTEAWRAAEVLRAAGAGGPNSLLWSLLPAPSRT